MGKLSYYDVDPLRYTPGQVDGSESMFFEPNQALLTVRVHKPSPIVGLTGYEGSGKSTVAALLMMLGYKEESFAEPLRVEVTDWLRSGKPVPAEINLSPNTRMWLQSDPSPLVLYKKPTPEPVRELLQKWGTEYRRTQDPNYWVNLMNRRWNGKTPLVIQDVRFQNEAYWIENNGGQLWRVERQGTGPVNDHASATQIIPSSVTVYNNGTVTKLAETVLQRLNTVSK